MEDLELQKYRMSINIKTYWKTNFTVVHYDQRASGKSYHFFEDYSNLSTDLLVEDLLAMTDYISERLGKEKVILMGHSSGTYIGMQAAYKAPEKYEAYIGIGQMSDTVESEMDSLNYVIEQAQKDRQYGGCFIFTRINGTNQKWRNSYSTKLCDEIWWSFKTH